MQTFLPEPSFKYSAAVLDNQRLGKQRVEAKQILRALRGETIGWVNHPTTKLWLGHEGALSRYGIAVCEQWIMRGFDDSLLPYFHDMTFEHPDPTLPLWFGWRPFHRSHQSNLVRKDPQHYRRYYPDIPDDLPYVWPV